MAQGHRPAPIPCMSPIASRYRQAIFCVAVSAVRSLRFALKSVGTANAVNGMASKQQVLPGTVTSSSTSQYTLFCPSEQPLLFAAQHLHTSATFTTRTDMARHGYTERWHRHRNTCLFLSFQTSSATRRQFLSGVYAPHGVFMPRMGIL